MEKRICGFLEKEGIFSDNWDWREETSRYREEMNRGLRGRGSLRMMPSYLGVPKELPKNKPVVALDAGGTNLRIALVTFPQSGAPLVEQIQSMAMPGSEKEISAGAFFEKLAEYLAPYLKQSDQIGFCFSYTIEIQPDLDGIVAEMAKQIQIQGLEGVKIAEGLQRALEKQGTPAKRIVLLNDSTAVLLAGAMLYGNQCSDILGFILGTGINAAYFESAKNISKISSTSSEKMAINMEASRYNRIPGGKADALFDSTLKDPGRYAFEKRVSGRYLGGLALTVIKEAGKEGLLSPACTERVEKLQDLSTKDLEKFIACKTEGALAGLCGEEQDRQILLRMIEAVLDRAAKLVAIHLSSVILQTGKGKNPDEPIGILAEGSTFQRFLFYQRKIKGYLAEILKENSLHAEFFAAEHTALLGAVAAGLSESIVQ